RAIERRRDEEAMERPRHRDVIEAQALRPLFFLPGLLNRVVRVRAARFAGDRVGGAGAEAFVGKRQKLMYSGRGPVAPGVRDDDHLELQTLRRVDRQEA